MRDHLRSGTEVLDGLRGIAILLVLLFHTWLFSWYTPDLQLFGHLIPADVIPRNGFLGVDLFFAISGFVLFFPYAAHALGGGPEPHSLAQFAIRRIVKIVPSYLLAFGVSLIAMVALKQQFDLWPTIWQHLTFLDDMFYQPLGFANSVFWSLAIEMQFYLFFPAIAWVFVRFPWLAATAMTATALAYRVHTADCCIGWETAYRELPAFLDVFAAGMLAAYCFVLLRTRVERLERFAIPATVLAFASVVCLWLLALSSNAIQYDTNGPPLWAVWHRTPWAFALAAFMVSASVSFPIVRGVVANRVLVFFSLISYNLYLWHTLVLIYLWKGNVLHAATKNPHDDDHWKFAYITIGWLVAIGISTALTYFFERPLLSRISPQSFSFDWGRLRPAPVKRSPPRRAVPKRKRT